MSRNTEFQFVSTDAAEITNFLITVYENLTGVSVRPASPEKLFAQWVASVIIQERVYNNYTANQNIPSRAEGKNLDALAELYYLQQRPQAKPAYCTERFTISEAQTFAILVPKGTRVTDASNTLIWETVADAYINAGDTYVDTAIRCQTDGTVGNGYAVGQLNVIVDVFDYYTSCTNITTSDDGSEIASDEEFYELMRESMFAFSTAGAVGSYIYHAKSVSTEIADVQAVRPAVVKKVTLDLYTKGGAKYAFWGGDTIDLSSLAVYAKGSSTAASADTDYTVTYENGLLQVAIAADGALASASQIDVSLTFDGAGHVDIYVLMNDGTIATTEIKNAVLAACNESKVRPLADYVSVKISTHAPAGGATAIFHKSVMRFCGKLPKDDTVLCLASFGFPRRDPKAVYLAWISCANLPQKCVRQGLALKDQGTSCFHEGLASHAFDPVLV